MAAQVLMQQLREQFPEMRMLFVNHGRTRVLHDVLMAHLATAAQRAQPSPEVMTARLMEAGYHVTSQPVDAIPMRKPGTKQVTPARDQTRKFTSHSQTGRLLLAYVLAGYEGYTDDEAARAAGIPEQSCYWKRCGELRSAGLIQPRRLDGDDTPVQRVAWTGQLRTVCAITPEGRAVALSLED